MQYFSIISCTLFLIFVVYFPKQVSCGEITLKIKNYSSRDGFIHIAIYNNKIDFPYERGKYLGFKEKANSVIDKGFIIYNLGLIFNIFVSVQITRKVNAIERIILLTVPNGIFFPA